MHRMYRYLLFLNFLQGLLLNHVRPRCRFCDYFLHRLYQHLFVTIYYLKGIDTDFFKISMPFILVNQTEKLALLIRIQ